MVLVKKVQLLLRINSNYYLVKHQETGIIWLLFLIALAITLKALIYKMNKNKHNDPYLDTVVIQND